MIVSHRHRFIFVRTRKTAGTSSIALSFADPTISSRATDDVLPRTRLSGRRMMAAPLVGPFSECRLLRGERARFKTPPATRIRSLVGEEIWRSYYKFAIERDPWTKRFRCTTGERATSNRAACWSSCGVGARSLSNAHIYLIDGALGVDRVIAYENLATQLEEIRRHLALPEPVTLPRAKSTHRTEKSHYSELIGDAERAVIDATCRREIDLLGYQFRHIARKSEVT
jgi:hypothetical protein